MRNELEVLTRIETLQRQLAEKQAALLPPNRIPTVGECATFATFRDMAQSEIEALEWVLGVTADAVEDNIMTGDSVCLHVMGEVIEASDGHGQCYRVKLPQKDFQGPRIVWVNPDELFREKN